MRLKSALSTAARLVGSLAFAVHAPAFAQQSAASQQLEQKGFVRCAKATASVLDFLYEKQAYGYVNVWHVASPDSHLASTLTARQFPDGQGVASVVSAPTAAGTCDTAFSQVVALAQPCSQIQAGAFREWRKSADLSGVPVFQDPTAPNITAMLFPTGAASCLVVKSGVLYF